MAKRRKAVRTILVATFRRRRRRRSRRKVKEWKMRRNVKKALKSATGIELERERVASRAGRLAMRPPKFLMHTTLAEAPTNRPKAHRIGGRYRFSPARPGLFLWALLLESDRLRIANCFALLPWSVGRFLLFVAVAAVIIIKNFI